MRRREFLALSALLPASLVGCSSEPGAGARQTSKAAPNGPEGKGFSYSPKGYHGDVTVSLDEVPDSVVTDVYAAAALQPYGITPSGVFGYGKGQAAAGDLDFDELNSIGLNGEFNLEKFAAVEPDLVIGAGNPDGSGWQWWDDKVTKQVTRLAPFLPISDDGMLPGEQIEEYRTIAEKLGGAVDSPELDGQRARFERLMDRLRTIGKRKPLKIYAIEINNGKIWVTKTSSQVRMLIEAGFELVGPDHSGATKPQPTSWEKIGAWPADVILMHDRSVDYKDNRLYTNLPAVQADQVGTWNNQRALTYESYNGWLDELVNLLARAEDITD